MRAGSPRCAHHRHAPDLLGKRCLCEQRRDARCGRGPVVRRRAIGSHLAPASVEKSSRAAAIAFHATRHWRVAGAAATHALAIRPTQQRAGPPSGPAGLFLCHEAGVSPCAPDRRAFARVSAATGETLTFGATQRGLGGVPVSAMARRVRARARARRSGPVYDRPLALGGHEPDRWDSPPVKRGRDADARWSVFAQVELGGDRVRRSPAR